MRATVLRDERLAQKHAGRFVWLAIDTENPANAAFVARYPIQSWPTFLVIDPRDERPILKWLGAATAADLDRLLSDVDRSPRRGAAALLAEADRANAARQVDVAVARYREALAVGGPRWDRRPRAVESLVVALSEAGRREECAAAARREASGLPRGPSFANVASVGLSCAVDAPAEADWRAGALDALEPLAAEALRLRGLLADDRSGLYEGLCGAREARGDADGARRVAERWWGFLDEEGRRGRTPEQRAALDGIRVGVAIRLGDPARALPALARSARELPRDYNPPARRALVLRELGRLDEARSAAREALALAYGPRKLRVYDLLASIAQRQGDRAALEAVVAEATAYAAGLPEGQREAPLVARIRGRLDTVAE